MLGAEVEHLLRLADRADRRAGERPPLEDQLHRGDRQRLRRRADVDKRTVGLQQRQEAADVDARADGVDDQVEAARQLLEGRLVARGVIVVGAQLETVLLLAQRLRQDGDLGAHRLGDLHGHVAETTEADHPDVLAGIGVPVAQRRVGRDPGAQQRRRGIELQTVRDAYDEVRVADDVIGVAAVGHGSVTVDRAVGLRVAGEAVLLVARQAVLALPARVDHAADTDAVTGRELGHVGADLGDDAGDLVPRYRRVGDLSPLATSEVDVRVADPAELDVDPPVLGPERSTLDLQRTKRGIRGERADGASRRRPGRLCSQRGGCHAEHGMSAPGLKRGAVSPPLRLRGVDRRAEIRDFLISRRAKVSPEAAGLYVIEGDRPRRVPGLRREEVADLAGLSVDYYTQLERGDLDGASDSVLTAVARALRLDDAERLHLFHLARPEAATRLPPSHGAIRPSVQRTLDAFTGGMALVRNRRWDYLAANTLGRAVYAEVFDGRAGPPNHVRYVFLDDRARDFFDPWPAVAHDTARILRSEAGQDPHDPGPAKLIEEMLQTSAEFRAVWAQRDVRLPAAGRHLFHHSLVGDLDLVFEAAALRAAPGLTLLLATAEHGSPTESALQRLAAMTAGDERPL